MKLILIFVNESHADFYSRADPRRNHMDGVSGLMDPSNSSQKWIYLLNFLCQNSFKDITKYMPLLAASEGELVMNLENVIDKSIGISGEFVVTLSFKYYEPTEDFPAPQAAHSILPMSKSGGVMFSEIPAVTSITIPDVGFQ